MAYHVEEQTISFTAVAVGITTNAPTHKWIVRPSWLGWLLKYPDCILSQTITNLTADTVHRCVT